MGIQEQLTPDMLSTPYLSMVQAGSSAAANGHEPGSWINSASGENFGPDIDVVCLAIKTAWIERDTTGKTWKTVGRYEPNSIDIEKILPEPGQDVFPSMINPVTGSKVEELLVYAVLLKAHPEVGVLCFSPTAISMSACKTWNTKIRNQRLPSGKLAPIFAFVRNLTLTTGPKPGAKGGPNDPFSRTIKLDNAKRGDIVAWDFFKSYVQPQIGTGQKLLAIATPEA
jgi:hypothetical protein